MLGGGGVTGIAWEIGLLKGLRDGGVDVTGADTVIGTSAGSVVGAVLAHGRGPRRPVRRADRARRRPSRCRVRHARALTLLGLMMLPGQRAHQAGAGSAGRRAGRIPDRPTTGSRCSSRGCAARTARSPSGPTATSRSPRWTPRAGRSRVFDRTATSTCCTPSRRAARSRWSGRAVEIGGRHYVDGGMRSAANADLATGCDVVLAVVPLWRALSRVPLAARAAAPHRRASYGVDRPRQGVADGDRPERPRPGEADGRGPGRPHKAAGWPPRSPRGGPPPIRLRSLARGPVDRRRIAVSAR